MEVRYRPIEAHVSFTIEETKPIFTSPRASISKTVLTSCGSSIALSTVYVIQVVVERAELDLPDREEDAPAGGARDEVVAGAGEAQDVGRHSYPAASAQPAFDLGHRDAAFSAPQPLVSLQIGPGEGGDGALPLHFEHFGLVEELVALFQQTS